MPGCETDGRVVVLCTVRGCGLGLEREERRLGCPRGHAFDAARSGYFNLLQPQDRRSKSPGDSREAVHARRRFLDAGHEAPIVSAIVASIATRGLGREAAVLDVGCGEGHYLGRIAERVACEAHGLDISAPAVDLAARRFREPLWVVANADRVLPYVDASFDLVASITSRRNADEFHRVLRPDGWLLVVLPAEDDLVELREAVLGAGVLRDRTGAAVEALAGAFDLVEQSRVHHRARLDAEAIRDLLASTYRGARARERERLQALEAADVTLAREVLWFRPRPSVSTAPADRAP